MCLAHRGLWSLCQVCVWKPLLPASINRKCVCIYHPKCCTNAIRNALRLGKQTTPPNRSMPYANVTIVESPAANELGLFVQGCS